MRLLRKIFGLAKDKSYDWKAVSSFMDSNDKLALGKGSIYFYKSHELEKAQAGFVTNDAEKALADVPGAWDNTWLVIGKEDVCNDPIFVDTYSQELPVFTAIREENHWQPVELANSLLSFQNIINELHDMCSENNTGLAVTGLREKSGMSVITKVNEGMDNWWWESMLQ